MSFIKCISNNKKRNLTIGKIYEVVCEVCDIETDEVIAYEFFNDKGSFTSLPVDCVRVIDTIRIGEGCKIGIYNGEPIFLNYELDNIFLSKQLPGKKIYIDNDEISIEDFANKLEFREI